MGVPKRRSSKMRTRIRKTANASKLGKLFVDPKTGNRHPGHTVDPKSGTYRGRQVLSKNTGE
jgi:large subunit ribosomal protein L32